MGTRDCPFVFFKNRESNKNARNIEWRGRKKRMVTMQSTYTALLNWAKMDNPIRDDSTAIHVRTFSKIFMTFS